MTAGSRHPASDTSGPSYLDCNATTPIEPRVLAEVVHYLEEEFGNAGSRTHRYGQAAKERVNRARQEVADLVDAGPDEVIFTSGATESNNLALLGLARSADHGKRHVISTQIEHKAILEPLEQLTRSGFHVTLVPPTEGGWVDPDAIAAELRPETMAVSVMAANNETGVVQPLADIASVLGDHPAWLHVDAAQTFGKLSQPLRNPRVELISVSAHKVYGPKGVGALITRRRGYDRPPIEPLTLGGGQERGLRPGTAPVALIAGLGTASALAHREGDTWRQQCRRFKMDLLAALDELPILLNGDQTQTLDSTVNFSLEGVDSEAAMLAVKDLVAISNGSACTSQSYEPSHVLVAMGLSTTRIAGALRLSWCHFSQAPDWSRVAAHWNALREGVSPDG